MSNEQKFQFGEIVDVAIKGARVLAIGSATITVGIAEHKAHLPLLCTEITRAAPAEWPPQPGDLWRDEKHKGLWYACSEGDDGHLTLLGPRQESAAIGDLARWGAVFVHREPQDGTS